MSADLTILQNLNIGPVDLSADPSRPAERLAGASFKELLREAQTERANTLKFSAHAQSRIESRQIPLDKASMERISGAVDRAANKGARESLILLDQTAFVISVPNRTVITVVDPASIRQNVFTNIDSAVIA